MKLPLNLASLASLILATSALALVPPGDDPSANPKETSAVIKSVDAKKHQFVLKETADKSERAYQWTDKTAFMREGKPAQASEFKEGERVMVTYRPEEKTLILEKVRLLGSAKSEQEPPLQLGTLELD